MRQTMMMSVAAVAVAWTSAALAGPRLTVLRDLTKQTLGSPEYPPIIGKDGNLYGTTYTSNNDGGIYSISTSGKNFAVLYGFPGGSGGSGPFGGLLQGSDGLFYGTTLYGGTSQQGTVYQFDAATRIVTILHAFDVADGSTPYAGLAQDSAGNFYGTTSAGGANNLGTIYKIAAGTHVFSKLADLGQKSGSSPFTPLLVGGDGLLYGTADGGGALGNGTIFRLSTQGGHIEVLHAFTGRDGSSPFSGLAAGRAGTFYGTTNAGGEKNVGVLFAFTLNDRKLTVLHSFAQTDGAAPQGRVALDHAGRLLGTTFYGGSNNSGTIYRFDPVTSSFQTLYELVDSVAGTPGGGLTYAGGKIFFGGTLNGGPGEFEAGAVVKFLE